MSAPSALLVPAAWLYRGINRVRRALYRRRLMRARRLPRVVVSVGNRAVGGAGKTPTVIAIARHLQANGLRVVVLSRGYGRTDKAPFAMVSSSDADRFGDEPALMARALPGVAVVVGADRFEAATRYLREHDCDVFVLDDGFQHLQLARDLDVVIESSARWVREGPSALADADFVLVRDPALSPHGKSTFALTLVPTRLSHEGGTANVDTLRNVSVFAFSGLADNSRFFATLESLGANVAGRREFPDHHRYSRADIQSIRQLATEAGASRIVTTEKDSIKFSDRDIATLEVAARLTPDDFFERLLQAVRDAQNASPRS